MNAIEELQARVARLEAHNAAAEVAIAALIRTSPDPTSLHLALTMAFEASVAKGSRFGSMTDLQIDAARNVVEHWGTIATRFPNRFGTTDDTSGG